MKRPSKKSSRGKLHRVTMHLTEGEMDSLRRHLQGSYEHAKAIGPNWEEPTMAFLVAFEAMRDGLDELEDRRAGKIRLNVRKWGL